MSKTEDKKPVFAQPARKLSAQELQKVAGGYENEMLLKQGGGQDFTGKQGFE